MTGISRNAGFVISIVFSLAMWSGCSTSSTGGGDGDGGATANDNGSDTGGGGTGDGDTGDGGSGNGDTGGGDSGNGDGGGDTNAPAIVKTNIILSTGGWIGVGDDLIVYGIGTDDDENVVFARFNQPAGVHYITPSTATNETDGGTMIPGSDILFAHNSFQVLGKKIALLRSTDAITIYDTASETMVDISPGEITLIGQSRTPNGPGQMMSDGNLIATINDTDVADGNAIKVVDVSGDTPVVISFANPLNGAGAAITSFEQIDVDAETRRVAAVGMSPDNDLFVWNIDAPDTDPQVFDFGSGTTGGLIASSVQMRFDGDLILYLDDSDFEPVPKLVNVTDGTVTQFNDNPSFGDAVVALAGGSFGYYLFRENADLENAAASTNVVRSAIGLVGDAPAATLANQLDTFELRPSVVDLTSSAGPVFSPEDCQPTRKRVGYGATMCVTPDGSRWFIAGWSSVDPGFDYVQMSTGGVFTDFADPEETTVTGSLIGTDIVCSADTVAFRSLREKLDSGCITQQDWVIAFIVLDRLDD